MLLQLSVNASLKVNPNFILFQTLWRKSRKNVPGNTKKPIDDEILFFFKIDGIYLRQQIRLYIVQYGKHGVYTCAVAGAHGVVIASFIDGRSQRCICASFFLFFFFCHLRRRRNWRSMMTSPGLPALFQLPGPRCCGYCRAKKAERIHTQDKKKKVENCKPNHEFWNKTLHVTSLFPCWKRKKKGHGIFFLRTLLNLIITST